MSDNKEYWQRLAWDWMHAESPGESRSWRVRFESTLPGREHLMAPDVRELVAELPDRLRVWRGAVRGVNEAGLSWTASRGDAVGWAHRNIGLHGGGTPVVLRGTVARDGVIALFVEQLETEILAFPENVTVEAAEDVSDERPAPPSTQRETTTEIEYRVNPETFRPRVGHHARRGVHPGNTKPPR